MGNPQETFSGFPLGNPVAIVIENYNQTNIAELLAIAALAIFPVKETNRRFPGLGKAPLLGIWHFSWNRKPNNSGSDCDAT